LVATASLDRSLAIWDARTFRMIDRLWGHTGWVFTVAWSPRGDQLLSASVDRNAAIWELARETRSPRDISELVKCRVPFALEGEAAVRVVPHCGATPDGRDNRAEGR